MAPLLVSKACPPAPDDSRGGTHTPKDPMENGVPVPSRVRFRASARPASTILARWPDSSEQVDRTHGTGTEKMARVTGTVERFMDEKGFGFIKPDNGSKDVFVHHSAIGGSGFKSLSQGQRVEFDLVQDPKGPRAENVETLNE
jgi:cold shock protein